MGLYFLSLGLVLIVASSLGTTPISSMNYVISVNTPLSLGAATFLFNMCLIVGQLMIVGRGASRRDVVEILLQIPFSLPFSAFIDINMALVSHLDVGSYPMALCMLVAGCVVQAVGVTLELKPRVAMMSAEGFVKYVCQRFGLEFGPTKVKFDIFLVVSAVCMSVALAGRIDGVREGTVIAAASTGYLVSFMAMRVFTRRNLRFVTRFVK